MKVKAKFDLASMQSWIFEHGEKVVFCLVALISLVFVYFAAQREVLDPTKQPEKLNEVAKQAKDYIDNSPWNENVAGVQVVDYSQRAKRDPVPLTAYAVNVPLNVPIFDPKGKRDDPQLFSAEELRVQGGFGSFALAAVGKTAEKRGTATTGKLREGVRPSPDAKLQPQPWAVVTGLVPVIKQVAEYDRVFAHAMGGKAERDTPHYLAPIVERAQVDPANPDKLDWQELKPDPNFEKQWEIKGEEVVNTKFCDPQLTGALGPLVDRGWDEAVAHPKIPPTWVTAAQELARAVEPVAAKTTEAPNKPPVAPPIEPVVQPYKLLRVFDYKVEPNQQYRYRIKLKLENPNFHLDRKFLKQPNAPTNDQESRETEAWSEPTAVVTIPNGYGVLAGSVESKSSEPAANLLLTAIDRKEGIPASTTAKIYRGNVANKRESKTRTLDPRSKTSVVIDSVDFNTGIVVVDIYGGKTVSLRSRREAPLAAPGEVLLLDASGNLIVRNDLDDHTLYEERQPPPEEEERRRPASDSDDSKSKKSSKAKASSKAASKSGR